MEGMSETHITVVLVCFLLFVLKLVQMGMKGGDE